MGGQVHDGHGEVVNGAHRRWGYDGVDTSLMVVWNWVRRMVCFVN